MIAVIIPTKDRPDDIRRCLRGLGTQTSRSLLDCVVVVDDHSAAPYGDLVELCGREFSLPVVYLASHRRPGAAGARNVGVEAATSDIIAFLDDDAVPQTGWLAATAEAMANGTAGATGRIGALDGGVMSRARQLRYDRRQLAAAGAPARIAFLAGGNCAVRREVLHKHGGFDETFEMMHDLDLALRLKEQGGTCVYVDGMVICHRHFKGMRLAIGQSWRAARFRVMLERRHPSMSRLSARGQLRSWLGLAGAAIASPADIVPAFVASGLECLHAVAYLQRRVSLWLRSGLPAADFPPVADVRRGVATSASACAPGMQGSHDAPSRSGSLR